MLDVAVIGGGPGGLHAATLLARAGFDVTLFEEHHEIGLPSRREHENVSGQTALQTIMDEVDDLSRDRDPTAKEI